MIQAACHCTKVRLVAAQNPEWVMDCNCTLCRRYGGLWAYYEKGQVQLVQGEGATDTYHWGSNALLFHRCGECGCVTHFTPRDDPDFICGINTRMMPALDPASVRIQQKNNSHSGFFWTRSDGPIVDSHHPKMAPPGPDDWR